MGLFFKIGQVVLEIFLTANWLPHGQPWANYGGGSFTHPILTTAFKHIRSEGHQQPLKNI